MLDTVESVRAAVETHPNIWLAVGVAVGPVATAALIGWVAIRFALPAVREELAASRLHMSEALTKRGAEAAEDISAARELARVQHAALVERIEGRVERLDERVQDSHTLLRSIATKIGAVALVLLLSFSAGFGGGAVVARLQRPAITPPSTNKGECDEVACSEEEYCCGHQKCCMRSRRAVDETEIARKPLSSLPYGLASIAMRPCVRPRLDQCEVQ